MKSTPYEHNNVLIPKNIPLEKICINEKDFQNRKKPYSEESVERIIQSVLNWDFIVEVFDPIIMWLDKTSNKLYILAGHSRHEAFKRLSDVYKASPKVQEYKNRYPRLFSYIPARIIENVSYEQAKTIAQISNVLATPETDIERAKLYISFRKRWKAKQEIEEFGKKYEGSNWPRIKAYSYLNPNGAMTDLLNNLEKNNDEKNIVKRIATRIGNARMKYPCLQHHHEQELFNRLLRYEGYWNKQGQVNSQPKFLEIIRHKIEKISPRNDMVPLNMKGDKTLPYAMAAYYKMLKPLQKTEQELKLTLQKGINEYQNNVIEKDITEYKKNLSEILQIPLENLSKFEGIEETLFDLKEYFSPENVDKIWEITCLQLERIKKKINNHKWKKKQFVEAWKQELKIDFSELQS